VLAATGNGSWLDVAADVVALATLGISGGITGAAGLVGRAGSTLSDAVGAGDQIVNEARAASLTSKLVEGFSKATDVFDSAAEWMGKYSILSPLTAVAEKGADVFEGLAQARWDDRRVTSGSRSASTLTRSPGTRRRSAPRPLT
jgi:hypothetical protein